MDTDGFSSTGEGAVPFSGKTRGTDIDSQLLGLFTTYSASLLGVVEVQGLSTHD